MEDIICERETMQYGSEDLFMTLCYTNSWLSEDEVTYMAYYFYID